MHSPQENGGGSIADSEYRYDGGRVAPREEVCFSKIKEFNTGVMKIKPGPELYSGLAIYDRLFRSSDSPDLPWGSWDTDQAVLNDILASAYDRITTLSYTLNTIMCCAQQDPRLTDADARAVVAHFSVSPVETVGDVPMNYWSRLGVVA